MAGVERFLTGRLKLNINRAKSGKRSADPTLRRLRELG
jgi:hypothetical protein